MRSGTKMMAISRMANNSPRGFNGTGPSDERRDPWNMPGREQKPDMRRRYRAENTYGEAEGRYYGDYRMEGGNRGGMEGYEGRGYGYRGGYEGRYEDRYNAYEPIEDRRRGRDGRFIRGEGGNEAEARMIGYDREDEDMPQMHYGGGKLYAKGSMMYERPEHERMHGAKGGEYRKVDEQMADGWVRRMQNADGTTGPKFKIDQTEQLRQMYCMECDKWEFFVVMNMMYSDYCEVARHMGVDRQEYYAMLSKAFLCDEDAGEHKLQKYMEKGVH